MLFWVNLISLYTVSTATSIKQKNYLMKQQLYQTEKYLIMNIETTLMGKAS